MLKDVLAYNAGSQSAPVLARMSSSRREGRLAGTTRTHLCYSWHRFCDQVKDLGGLKGLAWGVKRFLGAGTNVFEVC